MNITDILTSEFKLQKEHIENIIKLIDEQYTIPFIARYRKELTGSCDDQVLRELSERLSYLRGLEQKKADVIESITAQGKMTDELRLSIDNALTLAVLEDIYRPYRPKRRTRAMIALEKGLEPLAQLIFAQREQCPLPELVAAYIDPEKELETVEQVLQGANDIIAEQISDSAKVRALLRSLIWREGNITAKGDPAKPSVYQDYYDYSERVGKIPSHRVLALNRGEKEELLKIEIEIPQAEALRLISSEVIIKGSTTESFLLDTIADSYSRLIAPSIFREIRNDLTDRACEKAIAMFGLNLKPLLMQPPVKNVVGLGLDPAYRTGCKIAVVDHTGKVLDHTVIYPTMPHNKIQESEKIILGLIKKYGVNVIAIGNGTASKESEIFISDMIRNHGLKGVAYMVVSESGASVYSASKLAAAEFPEYDVSIRSAISIIRRLLDPLAELVKIDPKAIGVGQYQHDMPPAELDATLKGVVEDCVNSVGVDLNTASAPLLTYISGLNATVAKNIVEYRDQNGTFDSRTQLKKVPRLGPKAFELCAGFLRIPGGKHILDNTSVHPESYTAAQKLLALFGYSDLDISAGQLKELPGMVAQYGEQKAADACQIGVPTLKDIVQELIKPGRDPRDELPPPMLRSDLMDLKDLTAGMELKGTVRNVIDFGAFVDIGVHQDGLVHISQITNKFIKHPSEVLRVGDIVTVWVISVDPAKKRISLTMKQPK